VTNNPFRDRADEWAFADLRAEAWDLGNEAGRASRDAEVVRLNLTIGLWKGRLEMIREALGFAEGTSAEDVARGVSNLLANSKARGVEAEQLRAQLAEKEAELQALVNKIQNTAQRFEDSARCESLRGAISDEITAMVLRGLLPASTGEGDG